ANTQLGEFDSTDQDHRTPSWGRSFVACAAQDLTCRDQPPERSALVVMKRPAQFSDPFATNVLAITTNADGDRNALAERLIREDPEGGVRRARREVEFGAMGTGTLHRAHLAYPQA